MRITGLLLLCFLGSGLLWGQSYNYVLSWENAADHIYTVDLNIDPESGSNTRFQVPAWRPGRYIMQQYAGGVFGFEASNENGEGLAWKKVDVDTWEVQNPKSGPLYIRYRFYANFEDAGSSVLNGEMAYFNPVNFMMHVEGKYEWPCTLTVASMPGGWEAATSLERSPSAPNQFFAADYHDLVDCPTVLAPEIKTLHTRLQDKDFYYHFVGEFPNDKELEDSYQMNLSRIINEQWALFGEMPLDTYHFIYLLVPRQKFHAVEHGRSAMFALFDKAVTVPQLQFYLYVISSHEFFHLYNVKRIRPVEMMPYDYQRMQPTTLHWWTEGVTDYYANLVLARSGVIEKERLFQELGATCEALDNNFASRIISPAQSSFDSWLSPSEYDPDYHSISYYSLGTRLGFLLDLDIRQRTQGTRSLDDIFRTLYKDYYKQGKGYSEADLLKELQKLTGNSYEEFFRMHINGTAAFNYADYLDPFGLRMEQERAVGMNLKPIGVTKFSKKEESILLETVLPGSDAAKGGLEADMTILEINGSPAASFDMEAFFTSFKPGKSLDCKLKTANGKEKSMRVTWTDQWKPMRYTLRAVEGATASQKALLEGWLQSVQP